jgi:cysteinyl-tRNA synthetase
MSKSLGNFFTIRDVLKEYKGEEIRYYILTSQYRSPLNYSTDQLDSAHSSLDRLYTSLRGLNLEDPLQDTDYEKRFYAAMDDDFNTPEALAVLFELARETNRLRQDNQTDNANNTGALLHKLANLLGLLEGHIEDWFKGDANSSEKGSSDAEIDALIAQRIKAKTDKNWAEADRIRDQLNALNIELEDSPTGTNWRRR